MLRNLSLFFGPLVYLCISPLLISAQNGTFIPFGTKLDDVKTHLDSRLYARDFMWDKDSRTLEISNDFQLARYKFTNGELSGITDIRKYPNKDRADEIVKSCVDYLKNTEGEVATVNTKDLKRHYVTLLKDRIIELKVRIEKEKESEVQETVVEISSVSRAHANPASIGAKESLAGKQ